MINQVAYPERYTEFDIQAETYLALKSAGYDVHGEVRAFCEDFGRKHKCRLDLVVYDPYQTPLLIVECKDTAGDLSLEPGSRQHRRYSKFGLPVIRVGSLSDISFVIDALEQREAEIDSLVYPV